jgi:choline dehydrogenase-like flavoprotein
MWNIQTPVGLPSLRLWELDDLDFEARPGVRDIGWPISRSDLQPFYSKAWALFGLPPLNPAARDIDEGGLNLQLFRMGPSAAFTEQAPTALKASGCVRTVTGAVVTDVRTDGDADAVTSLQCVTPSGCVLNVKADFFVLATGGIENARLLLASRSSYSHGLGNGHDHVGRYFMEHPHYVSGAVLPTDHRLVVDPSKWDIHEHSGYAVQRKHTLPRSVIVSEGLLATAFYLCLRGTADFVALDAEGNVDVRRTNALQHWKRALHHRRLPPFSWSATFDAVTALPRVLAQAAAQGRARRAFRNGRPTTAHPPLMTLKAMTEQVPSRLSRVSLARETDRFGVPFADLHWRLDDIDLRSIVRSQELAIPRLSAVLGAPVHSLINGARPHIAGGWHHMGTTRMAASPRDGVVDANCRVHGIANLYVSGSSVFPTAGMANPTLTAVALGLRLGAHVVSRLTPARRSN